MALVCRSLQQSSSFILWKAGLARQHVLRIRPPKLRRLPEQAQAPSAVLFDPQAVKVGGSEPLQRPSVVLRRCRLVVRHRRAQLAVLPQSVCEVHLRLRKAGGRGPLQPPHGAPGVAAAFEELVQAPHGEHLTSLRRSQVVLGRLRSVVALLGRQSQPIQRVGVAALRILHVPRCRPTRHVGSRLHPHDQGHSRVVRQDANAVRHVPGVNRHVARSRERHEEVRGRVRSGADEEAAAFPRRQIEYRRPQRVMVEVHLVGATLLRHILSQQHLGHDE
mmetsp:Transcript_29298/g.83915  ORF Transcript_29298/g.83915 Transcript_29298/m.83915 type:complete len:276 (-) Transcript_29298:18-845(-)